MKQMHKDINMISVLEAIKNNTPFRRLVERGLSYTSIFSCIDECINRKYIIYTENTVNLTNDGLFFLNTSVRKRSHPKDWLQGLDGFKIPSLSQDEVYVPSLRIIRKL